MAIEDWSTTAASNTSVGGESLNGAIQTVSKLDNIVRGLMAEVATGLAGGIIRARFDTAALLEAADIPAGTEEVVTLGLSAADDDMGATWEPVSSGSLTSGRRASADGQKWQIKRPKGLSAWNVMWFGLATGRTAAQNDAAWDGLLSVVSPDDEVFFPDLSTAEYTFSTGTTNFYPMQLVTDGNVTLSGPNIDSAAFTVVKRGNITLRNSAVTGFWKRGFERFPDPALGIKTDFVSRGDIDDSDIQPITVSSLKFEACDKPNGETWATYTTGITSTASLAAFNFTLMAVDKWVTMLDDRPEVGVTYSCGHGTGGVISPTTAFIVRTEDSWTAYIQDPASAMGIKRMQRITGGSTTTATITPLVLDPTKDVPAWNHRNSSMGVYLTKAHEYVITQNGVALTAPVKTPSSKPITHIGWGYDTGNPVWAGASGYIRPTKTRKPQPPAPRPQNIIFSGDSLTDDYTPGHPEYVTSMMQFSLGCQIAGMTNIGASGNTTLQQYTALAAETLTDYTIGFHMTGTNDEQAGLDHSTFYGYITDIIDLFDTAGVPLVIGTNHAYYTRTQAADYSGSGLVTLFPQSHSQYHDSIMRAVADARLLGKNVTVVDFMKAVPPGLPQWLDWSVSGNRADGIFVDNVHPSMRSKIALAWGFAKAAYNVLCPKVTRAVAATQFRTSWFQNSWAAVASPWQSHWSIGEDGRKYLRCFLSTAGATIANGTTVLQLPLFLAPLTNALNAAGGNVIAPAGSDDASPGVVYLATHVEILTSGEVKVYGVDTVAKWIYFDVSYI